MSGIRSDPGLDRAAAHLELLRGLITSGMNPTEEDWKRIEGFPEPWAGLISGSLRELRKNGAPISATLERLHQTLQDQADFSREASVKCAQSLAQAGVALASVPGFSLLILSFLPEVRARISEFMLYASGAALLSGAAFLWILAEADRARFGGLSGAKRAWLVSVPATLERIFALISAGRPPDLAWGIAIEGLAVQDPDLAREWGAGVWEPFPKREDSSRDTEGLILNLGVEIRRSIQTGLIEGRGCLDRLESVSRSHRTNLRLRILKELNLLPGRSLKPLFLLVLPGFALLLLGSLEIAFPGAGP